MSELVTCPSGLAGEIRGLTVKEADVLAGASKKKRAAALAQVFNNCWQSTVTFGPYKDPLNWDDVLQGDRTYLLLAIRAITHGPEYTFKPQCISAGCMSRFEWTINLLDENDLPVRKLEQADAERFKAGDAFEAVVPSTGDKVLFHLPTGLDEKRATLMQGQGRQELLTLSLRMRINEIEGIDRKDLKSYLANMELGDANNLIEQFDQHGCGVETRLEVECPACLSEFDVELPFDQGFFFPSQKRLTQTGEEGV